MASNTNNSIKHEALPSYISSLKWKGSRNGYYFGSGPNGVGYYLDRKKTTPAGINSTNNNKKNNNKRMNDTKDEVVLVVPDHDDGTNDHHQYPPTTPETKKRPRRTVRISEDNNTTRMIGSNTDNNDQYQQEILDEAEKILAAAAAAAATSYSENGTSILLDLSSKTVVPNAIKSLEKAIATNEEKRMEYKDDPTVYMDSEVTLYEQIVSFKAFAVNPTKFYPKLLFQHDTTGAVTTLILPLLLHANPDIVEAVVALLLEWLDPTLLDVAENDDSDDIDNSNNIGGISSYEERSLRLAQCIVQMINVIIREGGLELIVTHLINRYGNRNNENENENNDNDGDQVGNGWKDILSLLENIIEIETMTQNQYPNELSVLVETGINKKLDVTNNDTETMFDTEYKNIISSNNNNDQRWSIAAMLAQGTKLLPWLFQQIECKYNIMHSSKDSKKLNTIPDSTTNGNNSSNMPEIQLRAEHSLEMLVLLSSKEDMYTIVPDWSQLPVLFPNNNGGDGGDDDSNIIARNNTQQYTANTTIANIDGIELLLLTVSQYKKRQPINDDELNELENASLIVASLLLYSSINLQRFVTELQGIELVLRCCKEQVHSAGVTLKWLDFACNDPLINQKAYEHLITAGGLKYIFPMFMGKHLPIQQTTTVTSRSLSTTNASHSKASKKKRKEWYNTIETTIIRMMYGITRYIKDDSPNDAKERFVAKFYDVKMSTTNDTELGRNDANKVEEKDYTKCDRLVELLIKYEQKARIAEYKFFRSDVEDEIAVALQTKSNGNTVSASSDPESMIQYASLEAKLAGGGDTLHRIAAIAAFCCIHSKTCHERILHQLQYKNNDNSNNIGIGVIYDTLNEFLALSANSDQKEQLQQYLDIL